MKFITILFSQYRNGEFLQLMKNIQSIILQFDIAALNLGKRTKQFQKFVNILDKAFKPIEGRELTSELKELDIRRDRITIGIKLYLQSMLYLEDDNKVQAANLLLENYEKHGKRIDKLPYQQQTAVTNSLLYDFNTEMKLAKAQKTVDVNDRVDLLKRLNTKFDTTYVERSKTIVSPAGLEDKRNSVKEAYRELTEDIEAYVRIADSNETYQAIVGAVNGLIEDYNQAVSNRLNNNSSSDDVILKETETE